MESPIEWTGRNFYFIGTCDTWTAKKTLQFLSYFYLFPHRLHIQYIKKEKLKFVNEEFSFLFFYTFVFHSLLELMIKLGTKKLGLMFPKQK